MKVKALKNTVKITISLLLMTFLTVYVATSYASTLQQKGKMQKIQSTTTVKEATHRTTGDLIRLSKGHKYAPAKNRCDCNC